MSPDSQDQFVNIQDSDPNLSLSEGPSEGATGPSAGDGEMDSGSQGVGGEVITDTANDPQFSQDAGMASADEESEGWPSEGSGAVESSVDPDPPLNQVESAGHGQDGGNETDKMADAPSSECRSDSGRPELESQYESGHEPAPSQSTSEQAEVGQEVIAPLDTDSSEVILICCQDRQQPPYLFVVLGQTGCYGAMLDRSPLN